MIRTATTKDSLAIAEIYNPYILEEITTFELEAITQDEITRRMMASNLPWLVFEQDDKVVGYAYASEWKSRSAYDRTSEVTIYVDKGSHGKGIGKALYTELIKKLNDLKFHALIGGIALPNDASIALHEKMGFKKVAHFEQVGFKLDQWIDVAYWQLILTKGK